MLKKRFFKTKDDCEVTFEYQAGDEATQVALVCESNGWEPIPMKRVKDKARAKAGDRSFRTRMRLPRDQQFQFRYLVDNGRWENDESADAYRPNEFGGSNSVLDTTVRGAAG